MLLICVIALVSALPLAPPLPSTLPDETSVVATTTGLYFVPFGQEGDRVLSPAQLGVTALQNPSVTWIPDTDLFVLASTGGPSTRGLWRVAIGPTGIAVFVDLEPTITLTPTPEIADSDYSVGLDTVFLLDKPNGRILALPNPDVATGADLFEWASIPPVDGRHLAVNGATHPFGVVVTVRNSPVLRVTPTSSETIIDVGDWDTVVGNPVTGEVYVADKGSDTVGKFISQTFPPGSGLVVDFNNFNLCSHPLQKPVDFAWDPIARKVVILAEDGILPCLFGAGPTGGNHLVRMPIVQGGPANNVPTLMTFPGFSDIAGGAGDIAYVRHDGADVTHFGDGGVAGDGSTPELSTASSKAGSPALDASFLIGLEDAPGNASAFLVLGLAPLAVQVQNQLFLPAVQFVLPVTTDGAGEASVGFDIPNLPELVDLRVYAQWWMSDVTTPQPSDLVSSQGVILTIGAK